MEPQFTKLDRLNNIDPDNIYYNLSMVNGNLSGGSENDPQIRFYETRDRPIVRDASKYEMSVIKFNVNGGSKNLPLLVPELAPAMSATASQTTTTVTVTTSVGHGLRSTSTALTRITLGTPTTGSSNVDGVYAITVTGYNTFTFTAPVSQTATWTTAVTNAVFSYEKTCYLITFYRPTTPSRVYFSQPVYWNPETDSPLIASAPNTMDLTNDYFYVYHYAHWLTQVNTTLSNIIKSIGNTNVTLPASTGGTVSGTTVTLTGMTAADAALLYVGMPVELTTGVIGTGYITSITLVSTTYTIVVNGSSAFSGSGATTVLGRLYSSISSAANFSSFPTLTQTIWTVVPRAKYAWNPATKLLTLYLNTQNWGPAASGQTPTEVLTLYYNTNFEGLFTGWHNQYTQANVNYEHQLNIQNQSDGQLNIWLTPSGYPIASATTYDWALTQEYNSTTSLWCPVESIVFTSSNIPVRNEEGSAPTRTGSTTIGIPQGGNGSFGTIITELTKDIQDASDWRQFVFYQPYAQYQIASLDGNNVEIRNVDIYVWWRNRLNGQLIPLRLYNNGSANMKILFRKKKA